MSFLKFAEAVQRRRKELGLTLEDVASRTGSTDSTVHRIETAQVKDIEAETLFSLMEALEWNPHQIYLAYRGRDPNQAYDAEDPLKDLVKSFVRALPRDFLQD
jgi:transcriptional regulator with XRE-family HTH domain